MRASCSGVFLQSNGGSSAAVAVDFPRKGPCPSVLRDARKFALCVVCSWMFVPLLWKVTAACRLLVFLGLFGKPKRCVVCGWVAVSPLLLLPTVLLSRVGGSPGVQQPHALQRGVPQSPQHFSALQKLWNTLQQSTSGCLDEAVTKVRRAAASAVGWRISSQKQRPTSRATFAGVRRRVQRPSLSGRRRSAGDGS